MSQAEGDNATGPTQLEIDICTTYYAQDIRALIYRRLGLIFTFGQFLLGSAIMTKFSDPVTLGFVIALISAIQAAAKFADGEAESRVSKLEMQKLLTMIQAKRKDPITYKQVSNLFEEASKSEPAVSHSILMVGQQCCHINLGIEQRLYLNAWQKAIAVFSGTTQVFTRN